MSRVLGDDIPARVGLLQPSNNGRRRDIELLVQNVQTDIFGRFSSRPSIAFVRQLSYFSHNLLYFSALVEMTNPIALEDRNVSL